MGHARQGSFFKSNKFQFQHGGELRRRRTEKFRIARRGLRALRRSKSTSFGNEPQKKRRPLRLISNDDWGFLLLRSDLYRLPFSINAKFC
jgi:hypothetical protein